MATLPQKKNITILQLRVVLVRQFSYAVGYGRIMCQCLKYSFTT